MPSYATTAAVSAAGSPPMSSASVASRSKFGPEIASLAFHSAFASSYDRLASSSARRLASAEKSGFVLATGSSSVTRIFFAGEMISLSAMHPPDSRSHVHARTGPRASARVSCT